VNELYTQEHWMMIQADLLEQSYSIFKTLHTVGRDKRTVFPKQSKANTGALFDPNRFQVQAISSKMEKYESIWEDKATMQRVAENLGYYLEYKTSSLDHPCIVINESSCW